MCRLASANGEPMRVVPVRWAESRGVATANGTTDVLASPAPRSELPIVGWKNDVFEWCWKGDGRLHRRGVRAVEGGGLLRAARQARRGGGHPSACRGGRPAARLAGAHASASGLAGWCEHGGTAGTATHRGLDGGVFHRTIHLWAQVGARRAWGVPAHRLRGRQANADGDLPFLGGHESDPCGPHGRGARRLPPHPPAAPRHLLSLHVPACRA